jgi:hypothetical protein
MRTYLGIRTPDGCVVTVDGKPLNPRLDLFNHSPTGFEWGYSGSGPAQLALAILVDHCRHVVAELYEQTGQAMTLDGDPLSRADALRAVDDMAIRGHQHFKALVVAGLPRDGWALGASDVSEALRQISAKVAGRGGLLPGHGALGVLPWQRGEN